MNRQGLRRYSEAFKRQVVSENEAGASCQKLSEKYGITGKTTINRWVRKYASEGLRQELVVIQRPDERHELTGLKQRVGDLERVVAQLSVEKIVLQASLAEAEARLGVEIKKGRSQVITRALADPQRARDRISQATILQQLGLSRQAHHQQLARERQRAAQEALVLELVRAIRQRHPQLGTRKLLYLLRPLLQVRDYRIGRDRLFALLARHELLVPRQRRASRTRWPGLWRCDNLLASAETHAPQQAWVADITYLLLADGFAYLALITDAYSRFIVGFDLSRSLAVEGCERALQMALQQRQGCSWQG